MACECLEAMSAAAAEMNTEIIRTVYFGATAAEGYATPTIEVEKINKRNRQIGRVPLSYCPFCGTRYVLPEATEISSDEAAA